MGAAAYPPPSPPEARSLRRCRGPGSPESAGRRAVRSKRQHPTRCCFFDFDGPKLEPDPATEQTGRRSAPGVEYRQFGFRRRAGSPDPAGPHFRCCLRVRWFHAAASGDAALRQAREPVQTDGTRHGMTGRQRTVPCLTVSAYPVEKRFTCRANCAIIQAEKYLPGPATFPLPGSLYRRKAFRIVFRSAFAI